ncbi:hypothetical protein KFK09_022702 [Dendrobium nobile]|uniref:Uncharacterized protein n=1 Tax=Dendrobium nobile TaxID=94219 RepID=A0A8T3AIJ3_DENNO|nr:hypothetical protein KFK09_022702 [Dendrobium nobile]
MASFESNVLVFFSIVGLVSAFLVGVASAADAPAPEPASGSVDISAPVAAAVLVSTVAFFGSFRG